MNVDHTVAAVAIDSYLLNRCEFVSHGNQVLRTRTGEPLRDGVFEWVRPTSGVGAPTPHDYSNRRKYLQHASAA